MRLGMRWQKAVPYAVTAVFITSVSYSHRSVNGLLGLMALSGLLYFMLKSESLQIIRTVQSPFLPLIFVVLVVAPFQETVSETFGLLALVTLYFFSRLIRAIFPLRWLLFGVAFSGFAIGVIRQLSLTSLADLIPLISKIAEIQGRNQAGTATAFGFVALLVLVSGVSKRGKLRFFGDAWLLISGVLMMVSDVMTGVVGSLVAGTALAIIAIALKNRGNTDLLETRKGFWLAILLTSLVAVSGVVGVNIFASLTRTAPVSSLQRDFSNLTGRREIWTCYADVVRQGLDNPWLETLECTGYNHANLHSTFLQAHLLSGTLGFLAALFAFGVTIVAGVARVVRSRNDADVTNGYATLGIGVLGAVFALTESYLFVYLYPTIVVFMFAPEIRIWPQRKTVSAFLKKKTS